MFRPRAFALAFLVSLVVGTVCPFVLSAASAQSFLPFSAGAGLVSGFFTVIGPAVGGAVVARKRRYLEVLLAGALAAGVGVVFEYSLSTMGNLATPTIGTGTGAVAALLGHYLARRFNR